MKEKVTVMIMTMLVVILWFVGFFIFTHKKISNINIQPVACTMEAKMCPDGSYVGRTGPNCEFAKCPDK
ncbi:MAG: hypothetical protein AAB488_02510 [Patescibacteria group bacterium]